MTTNYIKLNELVGKIKQAYLNAQTNSTKAVLEDILPELAESEDERIRNEIVRFIQMEVEDEIVGNKWIAWLKKQKSVREIVERCKTSWYNEGKIQGQIEGLSDEEKYQQGWHDALEKQGEPILANSAKTGKDEQKFREGDWVVIKANGNEHVKQIVRIEYFASGHPQYILSDGLWFGNGTEARLWTIQDAKPGDIFVASDGSIFLFGGVDDSACKYYAALTADNYIKINKEAKGGYWETSRAVYPATKEQRDLLFRKMKEEGYEWDAEKKELKKIEQKSTDKDEAKEDNRPVTERIKTFDDARQELDTKALSGDKSKGCRKWIKDPVHLNDIEDAYHAGTEDILNELASRIEKAEIVNVRQVLEWIEEQTKE